MGIYKNDWDGPWRFHFNPKIVDEAADESFYNFESNTTFIVKEISESVYGFIFRTHGVNECSINDCALIARIRLNRFIDGLHPEN